MKTLLAFCVLLCVSFTQKTPKFKILNKEVPLYVSLKGLPNNSDDAVSAFIKDSLRKAGFKIISSEENQEAMKQLTQGLQKNAKQINPANFKTREEYFEKLFANIPLIQMLTIFYLKSRDSSATVESFEEIGFKYSHLPATSSSEVEYSASFSGKKIGSNQPDSIARFLLKKM